MTQGEFWRFVLEQLTDWLTAIGTFGAVILTLYLARRDARVSLELAAGHRLLMPPPLGEQPEEQLMLSVVNVGRRPATIEHVGWRFGRFRWFGAQFAVQRLNFNNPIGQRVPVTLQDGERWSYLEPFDAWAEHVTKDTLKPLTQRKARRIYFHVVTSTGVQYFEPIERSLQERLMQFARGEQPKFA